VRAVDEALQQEDQQPRAAGDPQQQKGSDGLAAQPAIAAAAALPISGRY